MVEGENQLLQVVLWAPHVCCDAHMCTFASALLHTHTANNIFKRRGAIFKEEEANWKRERERAVRGDDLGGGDMTKVRSIRLGNRHNETCVI